MCVCVRGTRVLIKSLRAQGPQESVCHYIDSASPLLSATLCPPAIDKNVNKRPVGDLSSVKTKDKLEE